MDARRNERVPERVHLHQRRQTGRVAEVVTILPAAHRRARLRLGGDEPHLGAGDLVAEEGKRQAGIVAPAADAPDDHVGAVAGDLHLLLRLQAGDRLVEHHVVQDAAQRVLGVVARDRRLDGLADRNPQAAGAVGVFPRSSAPPRSPPRGSA